MERIQKQKPTKKVEQEELPELEYDNEEAQAVLAETEESLTKLDQVIADFWAEKLGRIALQ